MTKTIDKHMFPIVNKLGMLFQNALPVLRVDVIQPEARFLHELVRLIPELIMDVRADDGRIETGVRRAGIDDRRARGEEPRELLGDPMKLLFREPALHAKRCFRQGPPHDSAEPEDLAGARGCPAARHRGPRAAECKPCATRRLWGRPAPRPPMPLSRSE